jgi:tRNA-Thr(GGU) m(6)t(6)A37 methyltransferase TsaA
MRGTDTIVLAPIGRVESDFSESSSVEEMRQHPSRLVVRPEFAAGLEGLATGDRIVVVFYFHRSRGYALRQHPRGDASRPKQGVFALCSPRRPNWIGVTVAHIKAIEGNVLHVTGLDALDGTPLLDMKPYVSFSDASGEGEGT